MTGEYATQPVSHTGRHGRHTTPRPETIALHSKQDAALRMYTDEHLTYQQIADRMGYADRKGAWHAVSEALKRHAAPAEEAAANMRAKHNAILDRVTKLAEAAVDLNSGDVDAMKKAVDALTKALDRQSKLNGLDAAAKVEHSGAVDLAPADLDFIAKKAREAVDREKAQPPEDASAGD